MQSNNDQRSLLQPNDDSRRLNSNSELNISANNEVSVGISNRANETSSNTLEVTSSLNSVTRHVSLNDQRPRPSPSPIQRYPRGTVRLESSNNSGGNFVPSTEHFTGTTSQDGNNDLNSGNSATSVSPNNFRMNLADLAGASRLYTSTNRQEGNDDHNTGNAIGSVSRRVRILRMNSAGNMEFAYVNVNSNSINDTLDDSSLRRLDILAEVAARGRRAARPHPYSRYIAHVTEGSRLHNNVSRGRTRLNSVGEESVNDDE